jgi:hypothetical protein
MPQLDRRQQLARQLLDEAMGRIGDAMRAIERRELEWAYNRIAVAQAALDAFRAFGSPVVADNSGAGHRE